MTVTSATGMVKPIDFLADENGASGDLIGPTDVTSFEGISGIVDNKNGMFLVGVFLTDQTPSGDGPERLDFSGQGNFHELAPEIGQTFLIGDGAGRTYTVPSGASRLYLGFADAYLYQGAPGWYGNNQGQLAVSVEFADGTEVSTPELTPDPAIVNLSAFANIFGAGHEAPPEPGGGGGGQPPPVWPLPLGETRIVTFPSATGQVYGRIGQAPSNGPGGEELIGTNVESFGGISGIVHGKKAMFLVGVFLSDGPPADPAPARLDFTDKEDFDLLEPEIGQTFLIGDGIGRRYLAPPGATRLFLGFAEGMFYKGLPGWYGNNSGELEVKVDVAVE